MTATPTSPLAIHIRQDATADDVVDFCARPLCRREFRRAAGPGRPRDYCSDTCRRSAQKELKAAKLRLSRFEALVAQFRLDVAAFTADSDPELLTQGSLRAHAVEAVAEARGALPFIARSDDPAARAFASLYDGVAPFLSTGE